jgi:hypothetical protein
MAGGWATCSPDEAFDESPGDRRCEQGVAGFDQPHRGDEVFGGDVLEQKATGTGGEGVVDVAVEVERGQHEHAAGVGLLQDAAGGFQAVHVGHADVHEHDVGL